MPLFAAGVDRGAGTIMASLGAALALVRSNIYLSEREKRLERESDACLYQVPAQLIVELAINPS